MGFLSIPFPPGYGRRKKRNMIFFPCIAKEERKKRKFCCSCLRVGRGRRGGLPPSAFLYRFFEEKKRAIHDEISKGGKGGKRGRSRRPAKGKGEKRGKGEMLIFLFLYIPEPPELRGLSFLTDCPKKGEEKGRKKRS